MKKFLKSPKLIIGIGVIALLAIIVFTVYEKKVQIAEKSLVNVDVDISDEERAALLEKISAAEAELADDDDGNDFNAYVKIALAKEDIGDREGAAEIYRQMNKRYVRNYLSYQNLGMLYQEDKKCDAASEQFLQAIENAPRITHLYRNIINLYTYDCKQYSQDIPGILEGGLAIVPGSIDFLSMLAVYHRDFGKLEDAIGIFESILVHDPENESILNEVKELKERLRKEQEQKTDN